MELIKLDNGQAYLEQTIGARLAAFERKAKKIKEAEEKLKMELLQAMERHGITKIESEEISVTYIAETDRETFDSKAFRADNPEEYDKYVRISTVKPSIRLKVK